MVNTKISVNEPYIDFEYKSHKYRLCVKGGKISVDNEGLKIAGESITLIPTKI